MTAPQPLRDTRIEIEVETRWRTYVESELTRLRRRHNMYLCTVCMAIGLLILQTFTALCFLFLNGRNS